MAGKPRNLQAAVADAGLEEMNAQHCWVGEGAPLPNVPLLPKSRAPCPRGSADRVGKIA
jgi:hypothetical protein